MFLMFCLLRQDIFPLGDLGLRKAISINYFNKKYQITNPTYVSKDSALIEKIHSKYSLTKGEKYLELIEETLGRKEEMEKWKKSLDDYLAGKKPLDDYLVGKKDDLSSA